jgi:glycosyltransferase involved in cell wall biosynthesis
MPGTTEIAEQAPAVSLVVAVRNEAENVPPLTDEIAAAMNGRWRFELIFVNDGSDDDTAAVIGRLMAARPWMRQINHAASCGKAAAVRTGVAAARAPLVVTLDGDCQNDPSFIPAMVRALETGGDRIALVAGQRVGRRDTGFKRTQSRIANAVRAAILRDATRDTACGFKAFRRDIFLALPFFDGVHRFLPALVRRDGYDVAYVDVIDRPRLHGRSKYGFWDRLWVGILDLAGVWWLIRRRKRVPRSSEVPPNAR